MVHAPNAGDALLHLLQAQLDVAALSAIDQDTALELLGTYSGEGVKRGKDAMQHADRMLYRCDRPNGNQALPAALMHCEFGHFFEYIKARGTIWRVAAHACLSLHAVLHNLLSEERFGGGGR